MAQLKTARSNLKKNKKKKQQQHPYEPINAHKRFATQSGDSSPHLALGAG